ncbi:MAG: glycoside hydrolase family 2 protein, partial [Sphingobacteriales bacterium]
VLQSAAQKLDLNNGWQFRQVGTVKWLKALVPGSVHSDLLNNDLIPDPFFGTNEASIQWIDSVDWEYETSFMISKEMLKQRTNAVIFDGLDTYADIYLNDIKIASVNNMFRRWIFPTMQQARLGKNKLKIIFRSAIKETNKYAKQNLPIVLPDDARVYARKAQYQFNWDWGPKFVSAGIWRNVSFDAYNPRGAQKRPYNNADISNIKFVQEKDSIGTSFLFTKDGRPLYVKGANWIPAHAFPSAAKKEDYRQLLCMAKDAGMNMLRVWGGGIYEDEYFYKLCDSLDIMVWQDYMFACRMYPGDKDFFASVKAEVEYQVERLSKYNCIVLWCGNNEIDEGWKHWGWQNQFNLHGADSTKVWNDYERLFKDSLGIWTKKYDPKKRPYISTSPQYGWGNPLSYKNGDSHYWGLWWGLEPWEKFKTHTGRFVSEWGMQAMPDYSTVKKYTPENERWLYSPTVNAHQKAGDGFKKLNHYVHLYMYDTNKLSRLTLEEYTYLTQCTQYYILKNSIATQMSQQPANMGTLLWQLNDCWPVTSWSLIDFYKKPKAGYYAVKNAFHSMDTLTDKLYPKHLVLKKANIQVKDIGSNWITIKTDVDAKYIAISLGDTQGYLSDNYFDLSAGEEKRVNFNGKKDLRLIKNQIKIISLADVSLK